MGDDHREETFRRSFTGWSVSSHGYRVKDEPRFLVRYRDKWNSVEVKAEMLAYKPYGYVIEIESIPENLELSRAEIVDRIRRAFSADGAFLETFPDDEGQTGILLVAGAGEPVLFSNTAKLFGAWELSNRLDSDSEADDRGRQIDRLWRGVCQWAERAGVDRVKLDGAIPDKRAVKKLGFVRRGQLGNSWLEFSSDGAPARARTVLEKLPEQGKLWLTASAGDAVVIVVSGNWREVCVRPPRGDLNQHLASFRSLLQEVKTFSDS